MFVSTSRTHITMFISDFEHFALPRYIVDEETKGLDSAGTCGVAINSVSNGH